METSTIAVRISQFCNLLNNDGTVGFTVRTGYREYEWSGGGYQTLAQAYCENADLMEVLNDAVDNGEPLSTFELEWHESNHVITFIDGVDEDVLYETRAGLETVSLLREWFKVCIAMMYGGSCSWEDALPKGHNGRFDSIIATIRATY
jgi:hypothetical protein